jgi:L-fuconate dehydratase
MSEYRNYRIQSLTAKDVRFPTSVTLDGSDAVVSLNRLDCVLKFCLIISNKIFEHTNPDYSCAYATIKLVGSNVEGNGFTFTIGRGTEIGVEI